MAATERGWLISQSFSEATAHHAATIFGPRARRETAAPATGGGGVDVATYPAGGGAPVPQPRVPLSATPALHLIAEPPSPYTHTEQVCWSNRPAGQTGMLVKQAPWSNWRPGQTGEHRGAGHTGALDSDDTQQNPGARPVRAVGRPSSARGQGNTRARLVVSASATDDGACGRHLVAHAYWAGCPSPALGGTMTRHELAQRLAAAGGRRI